MVTLQITLPEDMLIFVEAQATARGFAGPSEYLQALIAGAQKEQEQTELEVRFANAMEAAIHAALQDREVTLNRVRVPENLGHIFAG